MHTRISLCLLSALCLLTAGPAGADIIATKPGGGHYQVLTFTTAHQERHAAFWHEDSREYRACAPGSLYRKLRGEGGCWVREDGGVVPARTVSMDLAVKERCQLAAQSRTFSFLSWDSPCEGYHSSSWPTVVDVTRRGASIDVRFDWVVVSDQEMLLKLRAAAFLPPTQAPLSEALLGVSSSPVAVIGFLDPTVLVVAFMMMAGGGLFALLSIQFMPKNKWVWATACYVPAGLALFGILLVDTALFYGTERIAAAIGPVIAPFSGIIIVSFGASIVAFFAAVYFGLFKKLPEDTKSESGENAQTGS